MKAELKKIEKIISNYLERINLAPPLNLFLGYGCGGNDQVKYVLFENNEWSLVYYERGTSRALAKSQDMGYINRDGPRFLIKCGLSPVFIREKLNVVNRLRAFSASLKVVEEGLKEFSGSGFVLLEVNTDKGELKWSLFDNNIEAEKTYLDAEKASVSKAGLIVALVSTSAVGGIKDAYPNFFADSSMFIEHLTLVRDAPLTDQTGAVSRILKSAGF